MTILKTHITMMGLSSLTSWVSLYPTSPPPQPLLFLTYLQRQADPNNQSPTELPWAFSRATFSRPGKAHLLSVCTHCRSHPFISVPGLAFHCAVDRSPSPTPPLHFRTHNRGVMRHDAPLTAQKQFYSCLAVVPAQWQVAVMVPHCPEEHSDSPEHWPL